MKQSIQNGIVWLLGIALMSPLFGWSQGLITGTVSDENRMPLPGATVVVWHNGGELTFLGKFYIKRKDKNTIVFDSVKHKIPFIYNRID